jgi:hypothetical protein
VDNEGKGSKTQVIFLPEYQQQAKQLYQEFRDLTKWCDSSPSMEMEDDNTTYHSNALSYKERMREIFGQAAAEDFPNLPISQTTPSLKATKVSDTTCISGSISRRFKKTLSSKISHTSSRKSSTDKTHSMTSSTKPEKLYRDAVTSSGSTTNAMRLDSGSKSEMEASVKSELKALKCLLISSHNESKAYRQELQRVNKEYLIMKHKIDVLLHALEEVSRWLDNYTISSLALLVASIHTIGPDELNKSPPKPSTVVFMADECKEGHSDQIPADSQLALVQVGSAHSSGQINDGVDVMDQKNGVWISPRHKHMAGCSNASY